MTELELNEARRLMEAIVEAEAKLKMLRLSVQKLVPILDGMPRAKNQRSKVEELTAKIIATEEEVLSLREEFYQASLRLQEAIFDSNLDASSKSILFLRYAACLNFSEIQVELKMTRSTIFYLHRTAKKKILNQIKLD